eukprot:Nk52_evm29s1524 gene=Nk52_evmTU29s1524
MYWYKDATMGVTQFAHALLKIEYIGPIIHGEVQGGLVDLRFVAFMEDVQGVSRGGFGCSAIVRGVIHDPLCAPEASLKLSLNSSVLSEIGSESWTRARLLKLRSSRESVLTPTSTTLLR